jgi:hypothetical protein
VNIEKYNQTIEEQNQLKAYSIQHKSTKAKQEALSFQQPQNYTLVTTEHQKFQILHKAKTTPGQKNNKEQKNTQPITIILVDYNPSYLVYGFPVCCFKD